MEKIFTILIILLGINSSCSSKYTNTAEQITTFYKQYISILGEDYRKEKQLLAENITPNAIEKIYRDISSTGANEIVRAQDTNDNMLKTVKAEHLENDWYMVSYYWDSNKSSLITQIPLKAYLG
ncbi:MAG: hypothetical protein R3Y50_06935 [Rikenellaceae bacterium]